MVENAKGWLGDERSGQGVKLTVAGTVVPAALNWKVFVLIVDGFIDSLNEAV